MHGLISAMGIISPEFMAAKLMQIINPTKATYKDLAMYHSREYLDFVLDPENSRYEASPKNDFGLEDVRGSCLGIVINVKT